MDDNTEIKIAFGILLQLPKDIISMMDDLEAAGHDPEDGVRKRGELLDNLVRLEEIGRRFINERQTISRLSDRENYRQAKRIFERIATDIYAEDSIPAALILLRSTIRSKTKQSPDVGELYERFRQKLVNIVDSTNNAISLLDTNKQASVVRMSGTQENKISKIA
jgi:hypothetical protein